MALTKSGFLRGDTSPDDSLQATSAHAVCNGAHLRSALLLGSRAPIQEVGMKARLVRIAAATLGVIGTVTALGAPKKW